MNKQDDGCMVIGRGWAGLALASIGSVTMVALAPSPAYGHAAYKDSNPADESTVSQAPIEIWAEYTEPPTDASYLRVVDPCGEQVDNSDSRPEGYRVYVTMSSDKAGTYEVSWFVDSAIDAHSTRGTFTFTASGGEPCPGKGEQQGEVRSNRERHTGGGGGGSGSGSVSHSGGGDAGTSNGGISRTERSQRNSERRFGDFPRDKEKSEGDRPVDVAAPDESIETVPDEPGLFEDIPVGGLVVALALAALIGAAGGFIYAGIMGYTRPAD